MKLAIVIGANGNENTGRLSFAESDATLIRNSFSHHGYEIVEINGSEFYKYEILQKINQSLDKCKEQDTVVFFFAGHGLIYNGQLVLALNNSDLHRINDTCINISEITTPFYNSRANNKLIILDCCQAGGIMKDIKFPACENYSILMSTEVGELAKEFFDNINGGIFSHYLNKALTSNIIELTNDKLEVTLNSIHKFISTELQHNFREVPSPQIIQKIKKDFVIASLSSSNDYIKNLLNSEEYLELDEVYTELFGQKDITQDTRIESLAVKRISNETFLSLMDNYKSLQNKNTKAESTKSQRTIDNTPEKVTSIANKVQRFVITGAPGSGKSTTLNRILYLEAKKIARNQAVKLPVLVKAHEYTDKHGFFDLLKNELRVENLNKILQEGKLRILIDGLNEVDEGLKEKAQKELKSLLNNEKYQYNSFIISSRKYGFENIFDLPVYELQDLEESDIKKYIENYAPVYADTIWENLQRKPQIKELSNNPLHLKMIIIFSKGRNGDLPSSRGQLYEQFTTLVLMREARKNKQILLETKIDVLSFLAYNIRLEGKNRGTEKIHAKELISIKLKNLNENIPVNRFLEELLDNYILKISENGDLMFLHEIYLEYFAAKEIRDIFLLNKSLELDLLADSWLESLLISAELFPDESRRMDFFNYLFLGKDIMEQNYRDSKQINNFRQLKGNINHNLVLPCRIAYNFRDTHPRIFRIGEVYMNNHLNLWLAAERNGIHICELEIIFAGLAALSSEVLFRKIFFNINWAYLWLYAEKIELESLHIEPNKTQINYFEEKEKPFYNSISKALLSNLSNYKILYNLLLEIESNEEDYQKKYYYSFSIINGIRNLKTNFFRFNHESELKKLFKNSSSEKYAILEQIGRKDLDFYLNEVNKFPSKGKISKIIDFLLLYHKYNTKAVKYILNILHIKVVSSALIHTTILELIKRHQNYDLCLKFLTVFFSQLSSKCKFWQLDEDTFQLFQLLHKIPYKELPISIQNWITLPKILVEAEIDIEKIIEKYTIKATDWTRDFDFTLPYSAIIQFKAKTGYVVDIKYIERLWNKSLLLLIDNKYYEVNIRSECVDKSKFKKITESKSLTIMVTREADKDYVSERELLFKEGQINKPSIFAKYIHPDIYIKSIFFHQNCQQIKENPDLLSKISLKAINLSYLFHNFIQDINYCIVTKIIDNSILLYSIKENTSYLVWVSSERLKDIEKGKVVTYEENGTIGIIEKEIDFKKIGYLESEIIQIKRDEEYGFIRNIEETKDYFFHFDECNFIPKVNDKVLFIPTVNTSSNYSDKPVAKNIQKIGIIDKLYCRITYCKNEGDKVFGYAKDIQTNTNLKFQLFKENLDNIKGLKGFISKGQTYIYVVHKNYGGRYLKIHLIERFR